MRSFRHLGLTCLPVAVALAVCIIGCHSGGQTDVASAVSTQAAPVPSQAGLLGDLNGSGTPDVADAIGILRIVVGLDANNPLADCDGNGTVGVADAILLLRCVVGLDEWPIGGGATTIGPEGGTVTSNDGNVRLDVPAGALQTETGITVSAQSTYPADDGVVPGTCYEFGPDGTQFSQPSQLTIEYDEASLPTGTTEDDLQIHRASGSAWDLVPDSTVDAEANTVSAPIGGFSTYGIVGGRGTPVLGDTMVGLDGQTLVWVPTGSFMMGGTSCDHEKPIHEVTVYGFWMGRCEVTNAQYQAFCTATGRPFPAGSNQGDDHPVVSVSWDDAKAYCERYGYALPTEAQWEYGARGPDSSAYPWGDTWDLNRCCNYDNKGPAGRTYPVGSFPTGASWCGALDMAGNVWEWCADWYSATYYQVSPDLNPPGPETGACRVVRGGAWNYYYYYCRTFTRDAYYPTGTFNYYGFRVSRGSI